MTENANSGDVRPPPIDQLSRIWTRLNDHKMVQWTVGYVALTYGIQHAVVLTREAFEWPQAVERASLLLLILGLPLVMTFAWYHGERASRHFTKVEVLILSVLVVLSSLLFYTLARPSKELAGASKAGEQQASVLSHPTPTGQRRAVSIAVLPFLNLSSDKEQEFFSDGMTEEITSALVKVPGLSVIGRTSAFEFKGQNKDLRAIGQALGTTHLIEGSVRKAGNRVRITAQLIRADTGAHLWTANYDRDLTDVFVIQEDIATAIAGALQTPLGLAPGERLVANRSINPQSYEQYLRARTIIRSRNLLINQQVEFAAAAAMLEQVVARDPGYAPAWSLLVRMTDDPERRKKAAQEAHRLDPHNATYTAVVGIGTAESRAAVEDLRKQALAQDPNPDALDAFSSSLAAAGRVKEALAMRQELRTLEPFVPLFNYITADIMIDAGKSKDAIPILEAVPASISTNTVLAHAYAVEGRYQDAADTILAMKKMAGAPDPETVEAASRLIRSAPNKVTAPETLPALKEQLSFVYLYVGAPNRVLDYQESQVANYPKAKLASQAARFLLLGNGDTRYLWAPDYAPVRKTERFKSFVRKLGFVEYWRARGWPDSCRPVGADDFTCV